MATIAPTVTEIAGDGSVRLVSYALLTTTNSDGAPILLRHVEHVAVQVSGTFGTGGSLAIEGSNDGSTWAVLNNEQAAAAAITAAGIKAIAEFPVYIRPHITAGDGTTSLTAAFVVRKNPAGV